MAKNAHGAARVEVRPDWLHYCRIWLRPLRGSKPDGYREVRRRIAKHWTLLDTEVWKPLIARVCADQTVHPAIVRRWGGPDNAGALCALVLEAAAWWAVESKEKATAVRAKAARLKAIDAGVIEALATAAELLEERDALTEKEGLMTSPESIVHEIEALIEIASDAYPSWHGVVKRELQTFVNLSRSTSRRGPRLRDLLEAAVAQRLPGDVIAVDPDDAEVLLPNAGGSLLKTAPQVRQFLAVLDESLGVNVPSGMRVGPLQWIGPTALAHLLSVAATGELAGTGKNASGVFNVQAVEKARRDFLKKRRASTDNLASENS
jgi:hypothetical protein